jgi:hypothetical protein
MEVILAGAARTSRLFRGVRCAGPIELPMQRIERMKADATSTLSTVYAVSA